MDEERDELALQMRTAWEEELRAAGFALVDAPSAGIAGAYHWQLPGFAAAPFREGMDAVTLLAQAEARLDRDGGGAGRQRTPSRVALLRAIVQRLARLTAIDWRMDLDARLRGSSAHPFASEERRALLWKPVTARGSVPRLD